MKNPFKISMKKLAFSALAALAISAIPAHAADATWGANTTGNWTLGSNWSPTTAPGATSGLTNTDNATFSNAAGGTITIDSATQNIGSLLFSGTPAAYIIGSSGANAGNSLLLSSGGTINVTSSNAVNQTVNAPLVLEPASGTTAGSYTIQNNNSSTGALIIGGNITGGTTTQGITLALGGTNTSASNLVSGRISDGAATLKMAVTKSGTGTWTLSGNNTYSGATTVSAGTLKLGSATGISANTTLTVSAGTFDLNGFNGTVANLGAGTSSGTITNSAASGTNTLTINGFTAILASLITDGATAKTALAVSNNGGTPRFTNANNTFSGGLTLLPNAGANSRIYQDTVSTTLNGTTITKSTFGTGTINIGSAGNTTNAQLMITSANQSIYNPIVFNAAGYADGGKAAIRADGGGLALNGTLTAGASDINISAQSTSTVTASGQLTSSGSNGLTLKTPGNGSGTLTLTLSNTANPANNYTGNTTLQTLTVLALGAADQIPNGVGKGNLVNNGTLNMGGFNETINGLSGNGTVDGISGTPTLTVGDSNATSTFSGVIKNTAGTLAVTKIGTGTLKLSGANTFGGAIQVNAGLLVFANTGAKPAGTATTISAGSIGLGVGAVSGDYSDANVAALFNTNTLTGFNLVSGSGVALDTTAGNFTQTTGLTAARALTKLGSNTLTLSGTNTYNGTTTISAGTLKAGSAAGFSPNSAFNVAAGATLDLGGFNNTISSLGVDTATSTITNSTGSATLKISTALSGAAPLAQLFTGSLGLQIFGGGNTAILGNVNNTYSGGTIFGANSSTATRFLGSGTIGTGTPGALTSGIFGTGTITMGLATTDKAQFYASGALTINNALIVNTNIGDGTAGTFRLEQGPLTINGAVNANLADVSFTAWNGTGARQVTVTGAISGNSGVQVSAPGTGPLQINLTLNNAGTANSYAGNTTIISSGSNSATLTLGAANQIPNGAGKGNLIITGGNFNMAGFSETINGLSGNGTVDGISGTPTLTVGDGNATSTFSGVIKNTAGTLAVTKIGTGTLTLSGNNTYTGATLVTTGTLVVNGSLGSGGVTVQTGATLGGNITAGGTTTIQSGGILSVGNSPGTGSFATLNLAGTTVMEISGRGSAGIAYDTIGVSSALTYGGELKLTFTGSVTSDAVTPFNLFTGFTSQSANFANVYIYAGATQKGFLTNNSGVWSGLADLGYGDNQQSFTFTQASGNLIVAVPEPSTWALLAFSLTTVMILRRRRQS